MNFIIQRLIHQLFQILKWDAFQNCSRIAYLEYGFYCPNKLASGTKLVILHSLYDTRFHRILVYIPQQYCKIVHIVDRLTFKPLPEQVSVTQVIIASGWCSVWLVGLCHCIKGGQKTIVILFVFKDILMILMTFEMSDHRSSGCHASSHGISPCLIPFSPALACLSQILIRFLPDVTDLGHL